MITTERSIDIEAPADQVWAVLGRFMHIDDFHPRVSKVDVLSDATAGVGACRRCHFKDGSSVVEKVIDWQDGRAYRAELSEFSLPLNKAIVTLSVEPLESNRTRAKMSMDFEVKFGPIGWLMGKTMMSRMMGGLFLIVLRGLEERVVRGPKAAAN
ncbi:MAG: SRPBCC family protein [Actinomycetota bacterium]|nr:SRPBCC family protein [Actinomycetota bacterium]